MVGHGASLVVESPVVDALAPRRSWTGICSSMEQVSVETSGLSLYRLELVPSLWRATQRSGLRIFQHLSIPAIVDRLLAEWKIVPVWELDQSRYSKLEFKVQYGESDYAFISRLLEEAGIAFAFIDRESSGTELVLDDALPSREERPLLPYADNPNQPSEREFVPGPSCFQSTAPSATLTLATK